MIYHAYQTYDGASQPFRAMARNALSFGKFLPAIDNLGLGQRISAFLEMTARTRLTHTRPPFGISSVRVGKHDAAVREETVLSLPFCNLVRFAKDDVEPQPKMLVVAPLSGHFATLLRNTVETLLQDHEVYITDWRNARDVPRSAGTFGFEDYITYIIQCLEAIGPGAHVLAVCQPCVQTLAAVALMEEDRHPASPLSMTLMAGPIDTRIDPTAVNELAMSQPIKWFEDNLIHDVPFPQKGAGRMVYPGFVQLFAFMSMNADRHKNAHRDLYDHLANGRTKEAEAISSFYDDYFAVLDLPAEFYIETVRLVFQEATLAKGELTYRGRKVDPGAIRRTALLTVEGERDDICSVGQTAAAHEICRSLRPHLRRHHLQAGVGHYGTFSGRKWRGQIYPVIRNFVLATS